MFPASSKVGDNRLAYYKDQVFKAFYVGIAKKVLSLPVKPKFQIIVSNAWGPPKEGAVSPTGTGRKLWRETVTAVVEATKKFADDIGVDISQFEFDIWNEPNHHKFGFFSKRVDRFFPIWRDAFRRIRRTLPKAMIVGPSLAGGWGKKEGGKSWLARFLLRCIKEQKKSNKRVFPDIISWHNLGTKPKIKQLVRETIRFSRRRGPIPRIDINETVGWRSWRSPGTAVHFLAAVERANYTIKKARKRKTKLPWVRMCRSRFGPKPTQKPGHPKPERKYDLDTVDDLKAAWHVFKFYASMTGRMRRTAPRHGVDWLVSENKKGKHIQVLLAPNGSGKRATLHLTDLPGYLRKPKVKVTIVHIDKRRNKTTTVTKTKRVRRASLIIRLRGMGGQDAYFVTINRGGERKPKKNTARA
ncbi:MAG: hypothetical protein IPM54_36000 [Polyangiaceae bacterium]|nr:hypothetical protein [Polyangiaceae bacterium]